LVEKIGLQVEVNVKSGSVTIVRTDWLSE